MPNDTFRKKYHTLMPENSTLIVTIKEKAEELESLLITIKSREMSLSITNLEQCTMWATKAVVLNDEKTQSEENK